ncbi:AAA family ATPase [Geitlerinema sp. CS-897]|nr:AAA family ATPase [Geitlerinema sp. CS-897]
MLKIVVNAPKGGVGKTTLVTNISLFLAKQGKRVWALDLAQGGLMSEDLKASHDFDSSNNKIETKELEELPSRFPGSSKFDVLVADTDDYFKIQSNLLDENHRGWRVIVPLVPSDPKGCRRITRETAKLARAALVGSSRINLQVVINKCSLSDYSSRRQDVEGIMEREGILGLLSPEWIPFSTEPDPYYIKDPAFFDSIEKLLSSIGVDV